MTHALLTLFTSLAINAAVLVALKMGLCNGRAVRERSGWVNQQPCH